MDSVRHTPDHHNLSPETWQRITEAARIIRAGGTVAFPTETVYGLGADADNPEAVGKIYQIKQRPANHPLIVHIGSVSHLHLWAREIPEFADKLAKHFWPGPLTLILPRSKRIPDNITGGQDTVGIRIPAHPVALALLDVLGPDKALAAPSANRFGRISPTAAAHVREELGTEVDMILDGGACEVGLESTIVSFHNRLPQILRPGGIPLSELESILENPVVWCRDEDPAVRVSGALPAHYAPRTPLEIHPANQLWQRVSELVAQGRRTAILTYSGMNLLEPGNPLIRQFSMPADAIRYGRQLYAQLHRFDLGAFDYLLMEAPPDHPDWLAINDRLRRASYRSSE